MHSDYKIYQSIIPRVVNFRIYASSSLQREARTEPRKRIMHRRVRSGVLRSSGKVVNPAMVRPINHDKNFINILKSRRDSVKMMVYKLSRRFYSL